MIWGWGLTRGCCRTGAGGASKKLGRLRLEGGVRGVRVKGLGVRAVGQ